MAALAIVALGAGIAFFDRPAQANPAPRAEAPQPDLRLDGGLLVAMPTALPTGMSTGVGAGVTAGRGLLGWGARLAWSSVTEYTTSYTVDQSDLRLRMVGALRHRMGRGMVALRVGAGGTLVHETRTRNQGKRAGLSGSDLQTTAWQLVPAADLELVIRLGISGPWGVILSGGPSMIVLNGRLEDGWVGSLGVAWHP